MDHVLVLTAPRSRGVDDDDLALLARLTGGEPRRLGANGAEVACAGGLDLPEVAGVDLNILPAANRRKRLLIADMDSTMIPVECIDEIADFAGVGPEVAKITTVAMQGGLDFIEAMEARVKLVAGLPVSALQDVYDQRISLNPGGRMLVRTMATHGAHTALISGGFTFFTERVGAEAGFAEHRANLLGITDGRLDGTVIPPVLGKQAKLDALNELVAKLGLAADDAMTIGDGANDLAMIEAAGLGVGHHPKPLIAAVANAVLNHSDLDAALYLQGYSEGEFILD
ncbi:phosphoserine phosphatase SerB [Rhodobacteraceae bacterium NNCM2]|nr:phosphoserine phosphatase SerB [Coraliihabitans acroporae]